MIGARTRGPWTALLALVLLTGCGCFQPASRTPPPPSLSAGPFQATLTAVVEPPDGGSTTLTLRLWRADDGRIGAQVAKLENDLAWVAADGDRLAVWLPRSGVRYEGPRRAPGLPPWLARLDLLADEIGTGPVPEGAVLVADGPDWSYLHDGTQVRIRCEPDGRPTLKVITAPEGTIRLEYGRTRLFDGIPRPGGAATVLPDGSRLAATIGSIRSHHAVPEKRLVLPAAAAHARVVPAAGLADALAAEGGG
ncbi:MAG: hypothetical protein RLZZ127_2354 [Planctomycetota bacterium]|jgi:hypothetical protein